MTDGVRVSNDDLARILGRIESKLEGISAAQVRTEGAVAALDIKLTSRLDSHDQRLRTLEVANPASLAEKVSKHEERIRSLEQSGVRTGMIAGAGVSLGVSLLVTALKNKLGL